MHPQLRKPGQLGLLVGLADRQDQAYRFRGEAASHELQRPGRRLVQPLRIVHDADQWLLLGRGWSRRVNDSVMGAISRKPAHEALVSEADFIAAQDISAARGPAP